MKTSLQIKKNLFWFCIISSFASISQPMTLSWAHSLGGVSYDGGQSVVVDNCGNLYCSGNFKGIVDFDPGLSTYTLSSFSNSSGNDGYISKFDASGNLIWAKQFGGSQSATNINSLCFDPLGNIGFAAICTETMDLDPGFAQFIVGTPNSLFQAYGRLDQAGNFISGFAMIGTESPYIPRLKFDFSGNLLVSGSFTGTVDFDPGPGTYTLNSYGSNIHDDAFICKISPSGNLIWMARFGGTDSDVSSGLDLDASNNVFVSGGFSGTSDFDPGPGTYTLSASPSGPGMLADGFILKLDANGSLLWVKQFPSINILNISLDTLGKVYGTGDFNATRDFDPGPSIFNMNAVGLNDACVCKLDALGNFVWARQFGNTNSDIGNDIRIDKNNMVFVSGAFQSTVDFDPGASIYSLSSFGNYDAFLLQLDENANFIQARQFGGAGEDIALGLGLDKTGSAYVTGTFSLSADFDPGAGVFNLSPNGFLDAFICKVSICPDVPVNANCTVPQNICSGNNASLMAISNATVNWFGSYTSTSSIGTGSIYVTPTLSPGTYIYYAEASTCTMSGTRNSFVLTVNALPSLSLSAKPATICPGQSAVLSASGAVTYSWSVAQSGQTISVIPTASSIYSATGTNTLTGCKSTKTLSVIYSTCTGLYENNRSEKFGISPNPAIDILNIENEIEGELTIFDPLGKAILTMHLKKGSNPLLISEYKEGLYILHLKSGNEIFVQKFIKTNTP